MTEYRNEFMMQPMADQDPIETHQLTTMSSSSSDPLEELAGLVGRGGLKTAEEAAAERALVDRHAPNKPQVATRPAPRPVAPVVPPSAETFDTAPEWTKVSEADSPPLTFDLNAEINRQLSSTASAPAPDTRSAPVMDTMPAAMEPAAEPIIEEPVVAPEPMQDIASVNLTDEAIAPGVQNAIFDTRALEEALSQEAQDAPQAMAATALEEMIAQPISEHDPIAAELNQFEPVEPSNPAPVLPELEMPIQEPLPVSVADPVAELGDDPSMAFSDGLGDALGDELDRALELEMEQSLREEAFADLSASLAQPELAPVAGSAASSDTADALLDAFNKFDEPAVAPSQAQPAMSNMDDLGAALSQAMSDQPQDRQQTAQEFEQELSRLMGQAKSVQPTVAAAAPAYEPRVNQAPPPAPQPAPAPPVAAAPVAPQVPIQPPVPAAVQAPVQAPVAPTQPPLDYSDPVAEFEALEQRWQDDSIPASQEPVAPPPIEPPALSMMERVLGSASALGFAAKGQPQNPSFDDSFSQAFDEALSADLAEEAAKSGQQSAPAAQPPLVSAPPPMPRTASVSAPSMQSSVAPEPKSKGFGPDDAVFADFSSDNFAERENTAYVEKKGGKKVAAVVLALALLGGAAAFGYSYLGDSSTDAPTLMASTDAVKEKPEDAGGKIVPNQDQSVFKTADGEDAAAPVQEQLKDSSEEPVAIARAKAEDRATGADGNTNGGLVQPRRVRTVTVRPDGTIVSTSADDAVAVPGIVVPDVSLNPLANPTAEPVDTTQQTDPAAPAGGFSYNAPTGDATQTSDPISVASAPVADEPVTAPVQAVPTPKPQAPAPVPPSDTASATVNEEGISTGPPPPFAVQVSSQRSAAAANQTYRTLSRRYESLLEGKGVDIRRIEISGKGVYYRVRIPADTRSAANTLCEQLKSRGGDCFVTR